MNKYFDIVMYTNADGLGTECIDHAHRLPFIMEIAKSMEDFGKVLVVLRYRSIPKCWFNNNEKSLTKNVLNQLGDNLWTIRPTVIGNLFSAVYLPPLRWKLRRQMTNQIKHAITSFKMINQRVAWMTHPFHYLYYGCAGENFLVYECYDEHVFDSQKKWSRRTELLELELAKDADLNIATAKPLFNKLSAVDKKTMLTSNGVMYELFSQCRTSHVAVAPELKILKRPVIGMIGVLACGYDFELLDDIICKKREWSFVFVGKVAENAKADVASLSRHPNFHLFDWRPYQELPPFIKGFDVAIIPYLVNDWTNTINPNKVYDYFAAGVPVVAAPIVELRNHKECLTLCQNKDEFMEAVERAIRGELDDKVKAGINKAKALSWDSIAKEIISRLTASITQL